MKIRSKLSLLFSLFAGLVLLAAWAGWTGLRDLGNALDFVTGRAWDAADGAMEASISIGQQMIAVEERTTAARDAAERAAAEVRLQEAEAFGLEAIDRLRASGLFEATQVSELYSFLQRYQRSRDALFAADDHWDAAREELTRSFADFQRFMSALEEFGDGQVEYLEAHPDELVSWGSGLEERWHAADGAMEAQIHLLERYYVFQEMVARLEERSGSADTRLAQELLASLGKLEAKSRQLATLPIISGTSAPPPFAGDTWAEGLTRRLDVHRRTFETGVRSLREYRQARASYQDLARRFLAFLEPFEEVGDSKVEGEAAAIAAAKARARAWLSGATVAAVVLALLAVLFAIASIGRPLELVAKAAARFARGDQDIELPGRTSRDELGTLIDALGELMAQVRRRQETLAELAGRHADGLTETSSTLYELEQTMTHTTAIADAVSESAARSTEAGERGAESASRMAHGMERLAEKVAEATGSFSNLAQQLERIEAILGAVNDLSEQSKFLALNAAIEAARAGEAGRGFGVVATEVRNLATQSQDATQQIRAILRDIQASSDLVSEAISQAQVEAEAGGALAKESMEAINDLVQAVEVSREAAASIEAASTQQLLGVQQITASAADLADAARRMHATSTGGVVGEDSRAT